MTRILKKILLRPSLWTAVITVVAYWDKIALHGSFVYDDAGSIKNNDVVNGRVPLKEVFTRDYWGTPMEDIQSHKSFRPITTLTFRLNHLYSEYRKTFKTANHTNSFHLVNLFLHGVVTLLATETAILVLPPASSCIGPLVTGLLFGLHPVHVEAVTNITSRGELLMSLFFFLAFLSFARNVDQTVGVNRLVTVYILPWLCMTASMFSKEQGATTLITLVVYDFLRKFDSVVDFMNRLKDQDAEARAFTGRTIILGMQTVAVCGWRVYLNGETSPDFISDQNPAGFAEERFTRLFSVPWVHCRYIVDAVYPRYLAPDWSGKSIPLIESPTDFRIVLVLALWVVVGTAAKLLALGASINLDNSANSARKAGLLAFWGFAFAPFLLSSNLLVVVGLMKADRVVYLPLFGFCLLEALLLTNFFHVSNPVRPKQKSAFGYSLFMLQMAVFCAKTHERNVAWSSSLNLWMAAYEINPISQHTIYNCGYELSLAQRFLESETVLRPIADPRVDGPGNSFVYAMVLFNLDRCDLAHEFIDKATAVVEEKKQIGGKRNSPASLARISSNLLVARGFCYSNDDIPLAGKYFHDAVHADPTNEYAMQQAQRLINQVNEMKRKYGVSA